MKRIFAFIPALLLVYSFSFGQTIQLIRFDNSLPYAAGSGVSVHFKPNLFKIGNVFTLQLSDASGSFANPKNIGTVTDYFAPVINGIIPAGTPAGSNYQLRIVGSNPVYTSTPTNPFSISGSTGLTQPSINIVNPSNIQIKCLASENMFGYLNIANGGTSVPISFQFTNNGAGDVYSINLVNNAGTILSVLPVNGGTVTIPILPIGYYVLELQKTNNGVVSVFSYIVLVERDGTGLLNLSSESVCTGSPVQFKIENIDNNYPGSQYQVNFGDGTGTETYTHDSLIANPFLSHTFITPTCRSTSAATDPNNGKKAFAVDLQLLNKGLANNCTNYSTNSEKKSFVNASTPPVANFNAGPYICQTNGVKATNTSTPGSYGSGAACKTDFLSTWQYKTPSSSYYSYADPSWVTVTGNLNIPASVVTEAGCWMLKLDVQNPEGCTTVSTMEKQVSVELPATPNFSVNPPGVCVGQDVQLTDLSNAQGPCQNPAYLWKLTPASGFTGTLTDASPKLTFNTGGIYSVVQTITNSCGIRSSNPQTITVGGAPTVSFAGSPLNICKPGVLNEVIDFSLAPYKPIYSTTPFAPLGYSWTVSGDPANYEFITSNAVDYPKIKFKAFGCYDVTVTVNGACNPANSKTIQLCFKQSPQITNGTLSQVICSNGSTAAIDINADIPGAAFSWQALYNGVNPASPSSGTSSPIPAQTYTVTGSTARIYYLYFTSDGQWLSGAFKTICCYGNASCGCEY